MKYFYLAITVLVLSACTMVTQSTRLSTNLQSKEYNHIASRYIDRPTFTSIEKMSDGETVLAISVDNYGLTESSLRFSKQHVPEYLSLINKFKEWEKLARKRRDAFTKDIGRADTWGNGLSGSLKFTFHSGNEHTHFLSISFCAAGTCLDNEAFYFDSKNTLELASLLERLQSGALQQTSIDSIYQ